MHDPASTLRAARKRAGLTQAELAARAGTSQATLSAYENGVKVPSLPTYERLLSASGGALLATPARRGDGARRTANELRRAGQGLSAVLTLAEALPTRHDAELRYPRLGPPPGRPA